MSAAGVIGASDHYGRAELVTLAVTDAAPVFLDRRSVELIAKGLPTAPYHHEALELDIRPATDLVNRVRRSVAEHASATISTMLATYRAQVLIMPASPYDRLPDSLEEVLSSRLLTFAADGMLYRESLAEAAAERGMEVRRYARKIDPMLLATDAMGVGMAKVTSLIAQFGREAGAPWRKDHKMAAAAALTSTSTPSRRSASRRRSNRSVRRSAGATPRPYNREYGSIPSWRHADTCHRLSRARGFGGRGGHDRSDAT